MKRRIICPTRRWSVGRSSNCSEWSSGRKWHYCRDLSCVRWNLGGATAWVGDGCERICRCNHFWRRMRTRKHLLRLIPPTCRSLCDVIRECFGTACAIQLVPLRAKIISSLLRWPVRSLALLSSASQKPPDTVATATGVYSYIPACLLSHPSLHLLSIFWNAFENRYDQSIRALFYSRSALNTPIDLLYGILFWIIKMFG